MASHSHVMRPIEERHVSIKVDLMVWSTKMDLLALSYANGEVALHRLNWLKVWVLPPPAEGVIAKGIAWRPDGKVIAIGYSNRELLLVDVERKETICKTEVEGDITCVIWSEDREEEKQPEELNQSDPYHVFLPHLPSLTRGASEEHVNDAKGIKDQKNLNLLLVGLSTGKLMINVFGLYPRVIVDIQSMLQLSECIILDAGASKNQDVLLVTVFSGHAAWVTTVETPFRLGEDKDLITLAHKYGHIIGCLDYMDLTLQNIIEGWENIMMEMDIKLRTYASKVEPGRVSCDFLELLMFGTATQEMSEFLLEDLTEKGLKKLNHSIELSYINIQALVLKHLQAVGQSLSFQLDEVCGLSRCPSFNQVLGLSESDVMMAFATTGSFLIKVAEVQHVIDESLRKYKAFFRWLHATFLRLCEERLNADVTHMSQLDLQHIVDFLSGLEDDGKFNLEHLGQYLTDVCLDAPPPPAEHWNKILEKHPALQALPQIVPHNTQLSLVQEAKELRVKVGHVFKKTEELLERRFKKKYTTSVNFSPRVEEDVTPKVTHSYLPSQGKFMLAMANPQRAEGYHFMEIWTNEDTPYHTFVNTAQKVVDIQFYLPDVLSLLLDMAPENAGFAQVPYPLVGEPCSMRTIQGMAPAKFAVCGTRKVAVVLSDTRRKVKIFEMDVEEEDEEEGMDTTNNSMREHDLNVSSRT